MSFYVTLVSDSSKDFFPENKISHFITQLPTPITLKGEWEMGLVDFIYPHTWYNIREDEGVSELLGFEPGEIKGKVESPYIAEPNASFPLIYVYCDLVEPQIVGDIQAPLLKIVKVEGKDGEVVNSHYTRPHFVPVIRQHFQTIELVLRLHSGQSFQKGYGIGGWFKRLFRSALPFLSRGAKSVGKEVLRTGAQIANDLLEGRNLQESAEERAKETGRILAKKAIKKADDMLEMAFLLKDSPECAKSELNLFALPPTQTVIERGQWVQFHPIANVSDGGPIEFVISGSGEEYLDLSQTQLYVRAKILRNDGRLITEENKVGPVNLFLHSLFSQVDISLNERIISSSSNTYAYRAIIETLLNHGYDSKISQLTSEVYYKDTAGRMNIYDEDDKDPNEGFNKRVSLFKNSATVDMMGRLHVDLFNQDRLLLNLVDLKIKLIRSKTEFCLMGDGDYKVVFDHISLFVRKVRVNPGVLIGHAKALEKATAKYPIDRVVCKVFSIPQSSYSFIQDNVFRGRCPNDWCWLAWIVMHLTETTRSLPSNSTIII
ncbi:uncharacterized protein F54H12.2 [Trichonephila clavipes]|nr:uncharacterized protein F54H12.2 [Trichonephila clavipes]